MGGAAADVSVPVLGAEVPAGHGTAVALKPVKDPPRTVDGDTGDWRGRPSGFGGSTIYSSGELVYQDHIFDAYGPDNGQDKQRLAAQEAVQPTVPEIYRLDPAVQYLPGEFGIPTPGYNLATHYGDLERQDQADLSELHVGADADHLWVLARTTTMTAPAKTALLVLLDTAPGSTQRDVPWGSGIHSSTAEYALLITPGGGSVADLAKGKITALADGSTAANPSGYVNALEAKIPRSAIPGLPDDFKIAAATGIAEGDHLKDLGLGANLANVAFREDEPSRDWWDKQQAFSLHDGTIDPFFHAVSLAKLKGGANERYQPGPYYHDRIFQSSEAVSEEKGEDGLLQHYGVYLPTSYRPDRTSPVQWWFHFRGGNAHIAAAAVPRIFKDEGEDLDTIVVSPSGRGTSRWYVGKGQVDYQEVWADVHRSFSVDRDREYISGHSMGGWATYLLTVLQPDRFAAGLPASGPPTQGAYTGVDVPGCDNLSADGQTPCYTSANGGDPRAEYTGPLLDNLRWVPLAIYHGVADELVPVSGVIVQANRLRELGYRYRLYLFPAQEHYGPPIQDQWADGARYEHRFVRDPNPPTVTFIRSMPMERSVERVQSDGVPLEFSFDSAYWVSGLTPADGEKGMARIDARSLAIPDPAHGLFPEAGGPATPDQAGPYAMMGQAWTRPAAAAGPLGNGFTAKLTGTTAVALDTGRMDLNPRRAMTGAVTTEKPLRLTLKGAWARLPRLLIDGAPAKVTRAGPDAISVEVPAGTHQLALS